MHNLAGIIAIVIVQNARFLNSWHFYPVNNQETIVQNDNAFKGSVRLCKTFSMQPYKYIKNIWNACTSLLEALNGKWLLQDYLQWSCGIAVYRCH